MAILETPRILLRPWRESDADDLYEYASDPRVGPAAGWPAHQSREESLSVIRTVFPGERLSFAMVRKDCGHVVGTISLTGRERSELGGPAEEIGYTLHPAHWGLGLMPEGVGELLRYGFEELGLAVIWCGHYDFNNKSRRVIEKCGFRYQFTETVWVEKMGEERVELHYALRREEWQP